LVLDLAKNVFQVHGIDAAEKVVVRKQLRRSQVMDFFEALAPCLVGMEACATAHYWTRELTRLGHEVRLMPAKDVKAYLKQRFAAAQQGVGYIVNRPAQAWGMSVKERSDENDRPHRRALRGASRVRLGFF
jgi:transposase